MVSHYFKRWRPIAFSISSSGECIFAMAFSPFFQWLIEAYSWQGALLIIGGLQLNLFVCGALMRPLKPKVFSQTLTPLVDPTSKKVPFQCSMIQRPELLLYIVFAILATAGFFIPPLFLVPYANHKGIEQYWAAFLLSSLSLADLLGRLACGWLANLQVFRNLRILATVSMLLGTVVLLLPLAQDYWSIMVFSTMYGFLSGCVVAVHITSIVDIVGLASFDSALGLFMLLRTSGVLVIPPTAGQCVLICISCIVNILLLYIYCKLFLFMLFRKCNTSTRSNCSLLCSLNVILYYKSKHVVLIIVWWQTINVVHTARHGCKWTFQQQNDLKHASRWGPEMVNSVSSFSCFETCGLNWLHQILTR